MSIRELTKLVVRFKRGLVIGPSGVGKGFGVCDVMKEYAPCEVFVTGDWCREHRTELADVGDLVADELIFEAARQDYERLLVKHGGPSFHFFVDSVRSVEQCILFNEWFSTHDADFVGLHIDASPKTARDRIIHRAQLQRRFDDAKLSVVRKRLGVYFGDEIPGGTDDNYEYAESGGVLHNVAPWLEQNTDYHFIDGNMPMEDIRNHVRLCLIPTLF